jgi:hypothetical protein
MRELLGNPVYNMHIGLPCYVQLVALVIHKIQRKPPNNDHLYRTLHALLFYFPYDLQEISDICFPFFITFIESKCIGQYVAANLNVGHQVAAIDLSCVIRWY